MMCISPLHNCKSCADRQPKVKHRHPQQRHLSRKRRHTRDPLQPPTEYWLKVVVTHAFAAGVVRRARAGALLLQFAVHRDCGLDPTPAARLR
ncbi:hypothetical protein EVAR_27167_1 [Eumeta japonica]|uniref:Uncharacterized protein n=1 Tax=Eumeta variegata TaxID=151549 RepID=A0A4C1VY90_EUMVA|nr:hypothetical protein EVAR_27167_1 [Eumeta japonica]